MVMIAVIIVLGLVCYVAFILVGRTAPYVIGEKLGHLRNGKAVIFFQAGEVMLSLNFC